ncbi:energy transducer TonB [uncultured Sphingomonas sp.]|uniref:energy transducer TonB n=1 Tax=uncultured Sphingomonas sp. TaxID=158754 RepID=UPI0035CC316A
MRVAGRIAIAATGLAMANAALAQDGPPARAVPIGDPASWVPESAYPELAKRSGEQGRVAFTLDVDETGQVVNCKVTKTSESPLLDETACYLMTTNGRFAPPRDNKGRAVPGRWSSAITWRLAPVPAPVVAPVPVPTATATPRAAR